MMAAAVADYHVKNASPEKIKRSGPIELQLEPNPDILADLGSLRQATRQALAGADRIRRRNREPAARTRAASSRRNAWMLSC